METYCKGCEQLIPAGIGNIVNRQESFKFKDGTYCEKCAKKKAERGRKKL